MKFAHIADCHLGGWRDPLLREANRKSFISTIKKCIEEQVDFVIIAGDLFNNAIPPIDIIRTAVEELKRLQEAQIPVYGILGSHDYSPTGKTMIDILESAGLFINVAKGTTHEGKLKLRFTTDPKTGAQITGIYGKKGGLDKYYYQELCRESLEKEGYKIFCFHASLTELKPEGLYAMEAISTSLLPQGFNYYAGGHVHIVKNATVGNYQNIVYPGPIFPNNFGELEKLRHGSFVIVENEQVRHEYLPLYKTTQILIDATNKTPREVEQELKEKAKETPENSIVTIRLQGTLAYGNTSNIDWQDIQQCFSHSYAVIKNTAKLHSPEHHKVQVSVENTDEIEERLITENAGQSQLYALEKEKTLMTQLVNRLAIEKEDGMTKNDFEEKIKKEVSSIFTE